MLWMIMSYIIWPVCGNPAYIEYMETGYFNKV